MQSSGGASRCNGLDGAANNSGGAGAANGNAVDLSSAPDTVTLQCADETFFVTRDPVVHDLPVGVRCLGRLTEPATGSSATLRQQTCTGVDTIIVSRFEGSVDFTPVRCVGCTDPGAANHVPTATVEDGSCLYGAAAP